VVDQRSATCLARDQLTWNELMKQLYLDLPAGMVQRWGEQTAAYETKEEAVAHVAVQAAHWGAAVALEHALKDLQEHFWRLQDDEGTQLVRVSDLIAWATIKREQCEER
jgi:hypothetical protein